MHVLITTHRDAENRGEHCGVDDPEGRLDDLAAAAAEAEIVVIVVVRRLGHDGAGVRGGRHR